MIRCPTCGLAWSAETTTCPKDGTRLTGGSALPRGEALPTVVDATGTSVPPPAYVHAPWEMSALTLPPEPKSKGAGVPSDRVRVTGPKAQTEVPERSRNTGVAKPVFSHEEGRASGPKAGAGVAERRPGAPKPEHVPGLVPLPVAPSPDQKNPWGDEGSNTESTMRRVHETPKTQLVPPEGAVDPLIGTQLGEYRVTQPLGSGGMGIVYRGEQPLIGKQVAIKVLRPELASDPRQVQRLVDEARAVNAVNHPGLINIFSFGETPDGAKYFVMDLLEGQSLEELLHSRGRLKAWEAVPILEGALSALDAAHGAGVIHRDLKPSNIFMVDLPDHTHLVKLLDFGLAKMGAQRQGNTPQTMNVVVGTPEYMAPEQARGHEISPRTDIYAMGIVAYELLTGEVPFTCESAVETLMMQIDVVPKPPGELEPGIPEPLEKLVMRMLAKQPDERPASAAEVKRELGRIKRQLTNAETRISQAATVRVSPVEVPDATLGEVRVPPSAPRPGDPPTQPTQIPPGSRRFDTDPDAPRVGGERHVATERVQVGTAQMKRPRKWWPIAVASGAALALLGAYMLLHRSEPEPVVVPPPPSQPVREPARDPEPSRVQPPSPLPVAPEPPAVKPPEPASLPPEVPPVKAEPEPSKVEPVVAKSRPESPERPRPPPSKGEKPTVAPSKRVEPTRAPAAPRAARDVQARIEQMERRIESMQTSPVLRSVRVGVQAVREQLARGELTPDQAWAQLDSFEPALK